MSSQKCSVLTLAPYKILPYTSGGPIGIIYLHHYIAKLCPDHIVTTVDTSTEFNYDFQLHLQFPTSPKRYLPFYGYDELLGTAKKYDITHIVCEHPYMMMAAIYLSKKLNVKWFLRSHNIESTRFRDLGKKWWRIMHYYERFAMQQANGVLFISPEDALWAERNYNLPKEKCHFVPFGTSFREALKPSQAIKDEVGTQLGVDATKPWLYFLGALDYYPNTEAVAYILDEVLPRLNKAGVEYQLLVAGKGLHPELQERINQTEHVKYTGFIPDIDLFLKACDIMLNPVLKGGGIKSKAVEALGYNKKVVSCNTGAHGLMREVCQPNLYVSADYDWDAFTSDVIDAMKEPPLIGQAFYDTYYWGSIAKNMLAIMQAG